MTTNSPLPTSFASLLVASFAALVVMGTSLVIRYARQRELSDLADAQRGAAVVTMIFIVGLLIYSAVGVVAGLRYRQERRTLNIIGLAGNALLLLAFGAVLGLSVYKVWEVRASRRLGGPVKIAEQYKGD